MTNLVSVSGGVVTWHLEGFVDLLLRGVFAAVGIGGFLLAAWIGVKLMIRYGKALVFHVKVYRGDVWKS